MKATQIDTLPKENSSNRDFSNLLDWPILGDLLRDRNFMSFLQVLVLGLFLYAIAYGYIHPGKENLFTSAFFWSLFWPFFMIITLPFVGKLFCSACPQGTLNTYLNRFSLNMQVPEFMKNPMIGLGLNIMGYWFIIYTFPEVLRWPLFTAVYFTAFTLLALSAVLIYKKGTYCKYLCPISTPTNLFSRLAFVHLATDQKKCDGCTKSTCVTGREKLMGCPVGLNPSRFEANNGSTGCTYCLKCVSACSHDAVRISFRPMGSELTRLMPKPNSWEVWGFALLFGAMTIAMYFHHGLGHTKLASAMPWVQLGSYLQAEWNVPKTVDMVGLSAFIMAMALTVGTFLLTNRLASAALKWDLKKSMNTFGYAMIPMVAIGAISHAGAFFFVEYYHRIVNGFSQAFNLGITAQPLASFKTTPWIRLFELMPYIGVGFSFYLLYRIVRNQELTPRQKWMAYGIQALFILAFLGLLIFKTYAQLNFGGHRH